MSVSVLLWLFPLFAIQATSNPQDLYLNFRKIFLLGKSNYHSQLYFAILSEEILPSFRQ